jgi:hypothetical protein
MQEMNIEFMADEWHDQHRRQVVWFTAIVDEKSIVCGISIDALVNHFGAYRDDPLPAFRANRRRIEAVAATLISRRRFEDDGKIMINSADL